MFSVEFEDRVAGALRAWSSGSSAAEDDFDPDEDETEESETPKKREARPN